MYISNYLHTVSGWHMKWYEAYVYTHAHVLPCISLPYIWHCIHAGGHMIMQQEGKCTARPVAWCAA